MTDLLKLSMQERVDVLLTLDPLDRVTWDGQTIDAKTAAFLTVMGRRLGYDLSVTKGSYLPADSRSGSTHTGGGVVDLPPYDHVRKVRVGRDLGAAIYYRGRRYSGGKLLWNPHEHLVIIGHAALSDAATQQVSDYFAGLNALADRKPDPNPYRPDPAPAPFNFRLFQRDERLHTQLVDLRRRYRTIRERMSAKMSRLTYRKR